MSKFTLIIFILLGFQIKTYSQIVFPDIDPKWDNYYNNNPSGIENAHQATDFINIAKMVGFVPKSKTFEGRFDIFETILLMFEQKYLRQMKIDGNYFSRTYKHNDYFFLYNKFYKPITKEKWDKYCPYLIPLMSLDKVISTAP